MPAGFLEIHSVRSKEPLHPDQPEAQPSPVNTDHSPSIDVGEEESNEEGPKSSVSSGSQKCTFMDDCGLESPDRRVISHFFGRNKKETRAIPDECWVCYCRQHYQRARYRQLPKNFAQTQMRLVRETVEKLEQWGGVMEWRTAIRKRNAEIIAQEDAAAAQAAKNQLPEPEKTCRERVLLPYVGKHKSFNDVYAVITVVEDYSMENECEALEFEIVPQYHPGFLSLESPPNKRRATNVTRETKQRSTTAQRSTATKRSAGQPSAKGAAGHSTTK